MFSGLQLKPSNEAVDEDDPIEQAKQLARKSAKPKKTRTKRKKSSNTITPPSQKERVNATPPKIDMFSGLKINTKSHMSDKSQPNNDIVQHKEIAKHSPDNFSENSDDIPTPEPLPILLVDEESDKDSTVEGENESTPNSSEEQSNNNQETIIDPDTKEKQEEDIILLNNQIKIESSEELTEENGEDLPVFAFSSTVKDNSQDLSTFNNLPQMTIIDQVTKWVTEVEKQNLHNKELQENLIQEQSKLLHNKKTIVDEITLLRSSLKEIKSNQIKACEEENFSEAFELDQKIAGNYTNKTKIETKY